MKPSEPKHPGRPGVPESTRATHAPASRPARRAAAAAGSWTLVGVIAAASASLGWFSGRAHDELEARAAEDFVLIEASFDPGASPDRVEEVATPELVGRLKADLLALRALYRRLADVAELDEGEFDLDFESDAATGDGEPLSALDPASPGALGFLIERTDPMLMRSAAMEAIFVERRREYDARVSGRPLAGGTVSSGFGYRTDPLTGRRVAHRGLDFTGSIGDPVYALADGVVTYAGTNGGYGELVELEHADGYRTRYAHNDTVLVALGTHVHKGQAVATLGNSGRSTGPHLHLEVRKDGVATDPRFFVR